MEKNKNLVSVTNPNNKASKLDLKTPEGRAIDRLKKQYEAKGMKNIDISTLLGWQTPKTSKVLSGSQVARKEDLEDLAFGLCTDPEPFMQDVMNLAEYEKKREFQTLKQLVHELCHPDMFVDIEMLMKRDFPYVMCKTAGLEPTRFVKRGSANIISDPFNDHSEARPEVYLYDRTVSFDNGEKIPIIGYWVDSDYQIMVLALCVVSKRGIISPDEITKFERSHYKGLLDVEDESTKEFTDLTRKYKSFPHRLINGEIISIVYTLEDGGPTAENLNADFDYCVSQYARLVKEVTGEAPNFGSDISTYDTETFDISKIIEAVEKSAGIGYMDEAKKQVNYKCFFDDEKGSHDTFITEEGIPFIETEMIIPIEAVPDYDGKIFIPENTVCLCPMCAAKIKNAKSEIREKMIWEIYQERKGILREKGIEISASKLMKLWNIY